MSILNQESAKGYWKHCPTDLHNKEKKIPSYKS